MAKDTGTPIGSGPNPDMNSEAGHINPSAPSAGTEGWGMTSDEHGALSPGNPEDTRKGQMKGNPGDHLRAASDRESAKATTNKRREDSGSNEPETGHAPSASIPGMNTRQQNAQHSFRCADAGHGECKWQASGSTEEEVMQKVVEHARDEHGMTDWSDAMHDRVRHAIQPRKAA